MPRQFVASISILEILIKKHTHIHFGYDGGWAAVWRRGLMFQAEGSDVLQWPERVTVQGLTPAAPHVTVAGVFFCVACVCIAFFMTTSVICPFISHDVSGFSACVIPYLSNGRPYYADQPWSLAASTAAPEHQLKSECTKRAFFMLVAR